MNTHFISVLPVVYACPKASDLIRLWYVPVNIDSYEDQRAKGFQNWSSGHFDYPNWFKLTQQKKGPVGIKKN